MKKLLKLPLLLIGFGLCLMAVSPDHGKESRSLQINGVNFVAPSRVLKENPMQAVKEANANWISVMPYAYGRKNSPEIRHNTAWQWWGEKTVGTIQTIKYAQEKKLKVMMKPHVWVQGDGWCGEFKLHNEEDWQAWEKAYEAYILPLAREAEKLGVEAFCIGTEYRLAVRERKAYWRSLIAKIRKVYSGQLTYAANWDNYQRVAFWDALDFIGIDAYWPLMDKKNASEEALEKAWQPIYQELRTYSKKQGKQIVFTEYGYRSVEYTARRPWETSSAGAQSMQAQINAYEALYGCFWDEPWFGGGFIWKWFDRHEGVGGESHGGFTPQNKPVMENIRRRYQR